MYREIKIGDIMVPMVANAATPLRYKKIFGKDIIKEFQAAEENSATVMDCIPELSFIMAKTAEAKEGKTNMDLLNEEMYISWLEQFDPMDIPMASEDIVDLYTGNSKTSSKPKKKETKVRA